MIHLSEQVKLAELNLLNMYFMHTHYFHLKFLLLLPLKCITEEYASSHCDKSFGHVREGPYLQFKNRLKASHSQSRWRELPLSQS